MRRHLAYLFVVICIPALVAVASARPPARATDLSVIPVGVDSPAQTSGDRFQSACTTIDPFVVTTILAQVESGADLAGVPAIVALRHSAAPGGSEGDPDGRVTLASRAEVGDVYGLAYDPPRHQLYASAYHRHGGRFGPGGPGQIYRIDLATGEVAPFAQLEAGPDYHDAEVRKAEEREEAAMVGKTGLGDLDIAADGSELYVTNLADRRIYRIGLPDGQVLGSFLHGAVRERWAEDARPFGLGVQDGWLYHGLVNARESSDEFTIYDAQVYRTRLEGAAVPPHEYVLGVNLEYGRTVAWGKEWHDGSDGRSQDSPILADIAFSRAGHPILGFRDREADMAPDCVWDSDCAAGPSLGDILPTLPRTNGGWDVIRTPPWYRDTDGVQARGGLGFDLTWGSLASVPGMDLVVAPARSRAGPAAEHANQVFVDWFDNGSGAPVRSAAAYLPESGGPDSAPGDPVLSGAGAGDIEVLCGPRDADDTTFPGTMTAEAGIAGTATAAAEAIARATALVATQTVHAPTQVARHTDVAATASALAPTLEAEIPTETAAAAARAATAAIVAPRQLTAVAPTSRAVATQGAAAPTPGPATATVVAAVHNTIQQSCGGQNPYLATARFVPMLDGTGQAYSSGWLEEQPAVVAFNDTPGDDMARHFNLAYENQVGAVFGVAHDLVREHLYVSGYNKRLAQFGPLGPGGIYQIELKTGIVRPWAMLPAGRDPHSFTGNFDLRAAAGVGRIGLGDIEVTQLVAGQAGGAQAGGSQAGGAPFEQSLYAVNLSDRLIYRLSVPDGQLLDVFPHGAAGQAWVEDAWPFGLAVHGGWLYHGVMDTRTEDALAENNPNPRPLAAYVYRSRFDGSEMREVARVDLDYGRQPPWQPWQKTHDENESRAQAMLTDIEFREDGDLVLGLRDRQADNRVMTAGYGDMVLTMDASERFIPLTVPEFYQDNIIHPESSWGTLASMPWLDEVVSTAIDPVQIWSGGIAWFDNISGAAVKKETIYAGTNFTFAKTTGLGDIEALCFALTPTATPTATGASSATPTATRTRTPSATPSATITPSPTITRTPTPSVYRIYLPIADNRPCVPEAIHTDAVLVIDMSTSMYRETRGGRSKHEAALEAAHLFVDLLDLEPDRFGSRDRVGLVGFNDRAWTAIGLTDQRAAAHAAIDGLRDRVEQGTRLDLAIDEGQAVLDRGPRIAHNEPVVILLTDGLPNRVPTPVGGGRQEDTVLAAADRAKQAGSRLITVGLGQQDDVLDALLRSAASAPRDYFFAPDGEDLAAIYRQIAGRLTECP